MDLEALFGRISDAVDADAYRTPTDAVDPAQRAVLAEVGAMIRDASVSPDRIRTAIDDAERAGRLDRVHALSARHVLAASPRVQDYAEAARLAGEQEHAALELGGPRLEANLASVDRHRGVLAFLRGHHMVALDHFTRALERQRTPQNIGNVLAALLCLGELEEAEAILTAVRRTLPPAHRSTLDDLIHTDPDLAVLSTSEAP